MTEKDMIGKRIEKIEVNGYVVRIVLEDGTCLDYMSSDGGYSSWNVYKVCDDFEGTDV